MNTDITNRQILINCPANIQPGSLMNFAFNFTIISSTSFSSDLLRITSNLDSVILASAESQITLDVVGLQAGGETICSIPCTTELI